MKKQDSKQDKTKKKGYRGTKSHTLTNNDRIKGGRIKSDKKTLAVSLNRIVNCTATCPIYPCPVQIASKKYGGKCARKELPPEMRSLIMKYYSNNRTDHIDALNRTMMMLALYTKATDPKELREMAKVQMDYIKTVHGNKTDIDMKVEGSLTAESCKEAFEEYKKLKKK